MKKNKSNQAETKNKVSSKENKPLSFKQKKDLSVSKNNKFGKTNANLKTKTDQTKNKIEKTKEKEVVNNNTSAEKNKNVNIVNTKSKRALRNEKINEKLKQKKEFKSLSRDERKKIKQLIRQIKELNEPHKGSKDIAFVNSKNIVEFKDVNKYFTNGYTIAKVLNNVDLTIRKGDFVIILGPSGSGKTTLMNIISGLDRASTGTTNVCGKNLINLKDDELTKFRAENVGYVFQQYGLLPNLTVKENVEVGSNLQLDKSKRLNVEDILKSFDMWQHKDKFPQQLSGGQQQRVSIARAFAKNPTILFGDEPTGAIDEQMSKMVINEFININKKFGTTVIIVTHNPIFEPLGDLVIKFKSGQIGEIKRNKNPKSVDELSWGS